MCSTMCVDICSELCVDRGLVAALTLASVTEWLL